MTARDVILLLATWLMVAAVIFGAVARADRGDYPPAPSEAIR